jgi:predicted ATPase
VTFFVGENGSGKSTLLEAIAVSMGFNAEGGTKNFRFDTRSSPTHSPILTAYPDAWIYQFTADGVTRVDYDDTQHVQVMRAFMANPERMIRTLLDDKS